MNTQDLKQIFRLIAEKREYRPPLKWLLLNSPEDITEDDLNVKKSLSLAYTKIISLPDDLKVEKNLILSNTSIQSLPKGLQVGGDLDISDTPIESLPKGLQVGGRIYVNKNKLQYFIQKYPQYEFITNSELKDVGRIRPLSTNLGNDLNLSDTPPPRNIPT